MLLLLLFFSIDHGLVQITYSFAAQAGRFDMLGLRGPSDLDSCTLSRCDYAMMVRVLLHISAERCVGSNIFARTY